jgi:hypothetical protein
LPTSAAVIVPALKLPDASLATIADAVLALVAFEVTVKVAGLEPLYVVDPERPVPEVFRVKVLRLAVGADQVPSPLKNVVLLGVPLPPSLAAVTIPEDMLDPFSAVKDAPEPENEEAVQTPVAFTFPLNPPLAVILVKVAVVPERVGIVAAAPTFTVVACKNAVVETPVALTFPTSAAVIVPALKLPEASRATTVETVLALVAFDVTVKVAAPELLNVVEPERPVPEVAKVRVFANDPENEEAVQTPVALTVVALRNPTVETPVEFMLPVYPPLAVILVKVAVVPERVGIVAAAPTFTVVA